MVPFEMPQQKRFVTGTLPYYGYAVSGGQSLDHLAFLRIMFDLIRIHQNRLESKFSSALAAAGYFLIGTLDASKRIACTGIEVHYLKMKR
ncbi:hypothetical protein [Mesorhizobium sp. M7A.F.Ca.US.008.03.1.1]|uniref:hypothetical protein n=1 Tax=Mesorhizobium sp. M7A.F.Ca.US.008.03.1.1 TaxID=2496742 RepID=UPI001FE156A7|nr:hypothetical protein [Mesorhizobium sp. M7A.F.Ca.US.008.03.1.1]